jgi:Ca2+-binding RTX toxin-like protein
MTNPTATHSGFGTYLTRYKFTDMVEAYRTRPQNNNSVIDLAGLDSIRRHGLIEVDHVKYVKSVVFYEARTITVGATTYNLPRIYLFGATRREVDLIDKIFSGATLSAAWATQLQSIGVTNPNGLFLNITDIRINLSMDNPNARIGGRTQSDVTFDSSGRVVPAAGQPDSQFEITVSRPDPNKPEQDRRFILARIVIHEIFHLQAIHGPTTPTNSAEFVTMLQRGEPGARADAAIDSVYVNSDNVLSALRNYLGFGNAHFNQVLADEQRIYADERWSQTQRILYTYYQNHVANGQEAIDSARYADLIKAGVLQRKHGAATTSTTPGDYETDPAYQVVLDRAVKRQQELINAKRAILHDLNQLLVNQGVPLSDQLALNPNLTPDEAEAAYDSAIEHAVTDLDAIQGLERFGGLGASLGSTIGSFLGGGVLLNTLVISPILATVGENLVEVVANGGIHQTLPSGKIRDLLADFDEELFANVKDAGVGALSSYLVAELVNALGIDGVLGEGIQTFGSMAVKQIALNLIEIAGGNHISLFQDVTNPAALASAAASFIGSTLADQVITFDSVGGQIGSAIGSAIGSFIAGMMLASSLNPVTFIAAVIVVAYMKIWGGLIGSLFGGTPRSGADVSWDEAKDEFVVANAYARKGGNKQAAIGMASSVADYINTIVATTGGHLVDPVAVQTGNYGMRSKTIVYRPYSTRDKHAITARFEGDNAFQEVTKYGIYQALTDADFQIQGGDVFLKRAFYNSLSLVEGAQDIDLAALAADMIIGRDYGNYFDNSLPINAMMISAPESTFAAGWVVTLARADELQLGKRAASDWTGGFNFLLNNVLGFGPSHLDLALDRQPGGARSYEISDDEDVYEGFFADTIDGSLQTHILGGDSADTISLVHEATTIEYGANLIALGGWPDDPETLPTGTATLPGWQNPTNLDDNGWATVKGPDGNDRTVIEAGDGGDGGNATNSFTIDEAKTYQFTYYFEFNGEGGANQVRFGLSDNASAYVRDAVTGAAAADPWFFSGAAPAAGAFETGRWYKVVGYVLPESSGAVAAGSLGGVFDTVTGDKVADTATFRWSDTRPNDSVFARFFGAGGAGAEDSTYFYRPEVHALGERTVIGGADRLASTLGLRIDGMDGDGGARSIAIAATIDAGAGDDVVHGGDMGNNVFGGEGNDTLYGGRLDDWLFGDAGNDTLDAGSATANSLGGDGNYLDGGDGNDILLGREGSDWLEGGDGVDTLEGGDGGDILTGGGGDGDTLHGGRGDDTYLFRAGDGDDIAEDEAESGGAVAGGSADPLRDRLAMLATAGHHLSLADWIGMGDWAPGGSSATAAPGAPAVLVNGGEDRLSLGIGIGLDNIRLVRGGAAGSNTTDKDLIIELLTKVGGVSVPSGDRLMMKDWFNTYKRIEWLDLADGQSIRIGDFETFIVGTSGNDAIIGTAGNDFVVAGDGDDRISLLTGNDVGVGGGGYDWISGDEDDDLLVGGDQDDHVLGGQGNDILSGDSGADEVDGGEGNDVLSGGRGDNDLLSGGAGNDTYRYSRGDGRDTYVDAYADESAGWEVIATRAGETWVGNADLGFSWDAEGGLQYYGDTYFGDGSTTNGFVRVDWGMGLVLRSVSGAGGGGGGLGTDLTGQGEAGDRIEFGLGINIQDLMLGREGNNLYVGISQENAEVSSFASLTDWIKLDGWYADANDNPIEKFVFAATGVLDTEATELIGGGDGDDVITGTGASEWITGNSGDDVIDGGGNDDILVGNSGSDTLIGGTGGDVMFGGAGNDIFKGADGDDMMIGGDGDDTVSFVDAAAGVAFYLSAPTVNWGTSKTVQLESVENVTGSTWSDMALAGDEGDNVITGGTGDDNLFGGEGDDTYVWNIGDFADTIDDRSFSAEILVGPNGEWLGGDRYNVEWETLAYNEEGALHGFLMRLRVTNLETGEIVYNRQSWEDMEGEMPAPADWNPSGWRDGFTHVLNGVDYGDGMARQIFDDTVNAGIDDTIELGEDISLADLTFERDAAHPLDLIIRYQGNAYNFLRIKNQDSANSHIEWLHLNDGFSVSLANLQVVDAGGTLNGGAEGDFLIGRNTAADIIGGGDGDDVISGLSGDDTLSGGAGDDTFEGGAGADHIDGGENSSGKIASGDTVRYLNSAAVTVDLRNTTTGQSGGEAAGDVLTGIENVVGSRIGADLITGNDSDNRITGLGGNDTLTGLGGADVLDGGAGDDVLTGGAGEDTLLGGDGADTLYGGDDKDSLDGGAGVDLLDGGAGNDELVGGADNDQLIAGAGDDTLNGGDGADVLDGGDGKDMLIGDAGNDQLLAGGGDDVLDGGDGVDSLTGGDGNDSLTGGAGNDQLEGGAGDDTYMFGSGLGEDQIVDASGKNKIRFDASVDLSRIWLAIVGDDLVISLLDSTDKIIVQGYFSAQNPTLIQSIVTTTHFLSLAGAGPLIAAMTDLDPATDDISTITDMLGSYWHEGETAAPTAAPIDLVINEDVVSELTDAGVVDPDDNITGYALGTAAAHGTVNLNAQTGEFTYTPAANYHGADAFSIVATDADGNQVDVAVGVTVNSVNDGPTGFGVAGGGSLSVSEAATAGTVVGQLAATDLDGDTLTYTLLNDAGGRFLITQAGQLSYDGSPSLDYETGNAHLIQVRVSDGNGGIVDQEFSVAVTDVNETPVLPASYSFQVAENSAVGTAVGAAVHASDPDAGANGQLVYSFLNSGVASATSSDGRYTINATTGVITTAAALDYEAGSTSVAYTVAARDNSGNAGYIQAISTVTIGINDANEANAIPATYGFTVNENVATGTSVGTVVASDFDTTSPFNAQRYYFLNSGVASATSADGRYAINETTGAITTNAALNFEAGTTSVAYTVAARDNAGNAGYTQAISTVTIGINNLNEANAIPATYGFTVDENVATGTAVGTVAATDFDTTSPFDAQRYYFLNGGVASATSSDGRYTINATTGEITTAAALNYEAGSTSVAYTVAARDNAGNAGYIQAVSTVTIGINDANDPNDFATTYAFPVTENVAIGTSVGTVQVNDPDAPGTIYAEQHYFFINGGATSATSWDNRYLIDEMTGEIRTNSAIDYEGGPATTTYQVAARDNGAEGVYFQDVTDVTVTVQNVNEANHFVQASYDFTLAENNALGATVGSVRATDEDGSTHAFAKQRYYFDDGQGSVSTVSGDGRYLINMYTGLITANTSGNFETSQTSFTYDVVARDNNGNAGFNEDHTTVTISVTDVNEAPVFGAPSYSGSHDENAALGLVVASVAASDPDTAGSPWAELRYSFRTGNPTSGYTYGATSADGRYVIDAITGDIAVNGPIDYETGPTSQSYTVAVRDNLGQSGALTGTTIVTIAVGNVNEENALDPAYGFDIAENLAVGATVGIVTATDFDSPGHIFGVQSYYFLNGTEAAATSADGRYTIDAATGVITTALVPDYEAGNATADYVVIARDNAGEGVFHQAQTIVTISVSNLNEAGQFTSDAYYTMSVTENSALGTLVGAVHVDDPDAAGTAFAEQRYFFTWGNLQSSTISATSQDGRYIIDELTGQIRINGAIDFENGLITQTYKVLARDNGGQEPFNGRIGFVEIDVYNADDAPAPIQWTPDPALPVIDERDHIATGADRLAVAIGTLLVPDQDAFGSDWNNYDFTLSDSRFQVSNGILELKAGESLDYETETELNLTVTATLHGNPAVTLSRQVTLQVGDVTDVQQGDETGEIFTGQQNSDEIFGFGGADQLYGLGGGDLLDGGTGNDNLFGGDGDDVLVGGEGDDALSGGEGMDALDGGAGSDSADYSDAAAGVTADLGNAAANLGAALGDSYVGIENLTGSAFGDDLRGDEFANVIDGGAGDDILIGRGADDTLIGGDGDDTLIGGDGVDVLLGGAGNDHLYGDGSGDQLDGGIGDDTIYGGAGNDDLLGGDGDDHLFAEGDDDRLIGGAGSDEMTGGEGDDTYIVNRLSGSDTIFNFDHGGIDTLGMGADVDPHDVWFERAAGTDDLLIKVIGTDTVVRVSRWFEPDWLTEEQRASFKIDLVGAGAENAPDINVGMLVTWMSTRTMPATAEAHDIMLANDDDYRIAWELAWVENRAPTLEEIGDVVINEASGDVTVTLVADDHGETANAGLDYSHAFVEGGSLIESVAYGEVRPDGTRDLIITPFEHASGTVTIRVTVRDGNGAPVESIFDIDILPTVETPIISQFVGGPGASGETPGIPITLDIDFGDNDGSEIHTIRIGNLPPDASLSAGTREIDGTWLLSADQLDGLRLLTPQNWFQDIELTATAYAEEAGLTGTSLVATATIVVNAAPTWFSATYNAHINENVATGTVLGTIQGVDPDGDPTTVTLIDNGGGRFALDANGVLTIADGALFDYEVANWVQTTIRVTDASGRFADFDPVFWINDVNEPNALPATLTFSIDENVVSNTYVGTATATDLDAPNAGYSAQRYYILNPATGQLSQMTPDGRFGIGQLNGVIATYAGTPNYELAPSYTFTVVAVDNPNGSPQNQASTTVTVNLNNLNEAPTNIELSGFVNENALNGTLVGTLTATDPEGGAMTYTLLDSAGGRFALSAAGQLTVANGALLNYEAASSHTINVRVTDSGGLWFERTLGVGLADVNEANALPATYSFNVNENVASGTAVGTVTATDPDLGLPFNTQRYYFWNGTTATSTSSDGRYAIGLTTGAITAVGALNFEGASPTTSYTVIARDNAGGSGYFQASSTVTIAINNVNEAPTGYSWAGPGQINENSANGTVVGTVNGTDLEGGTLTYSLVNNVGGRFAISSAGVVTVANGSLLNYEVANQHTMTVRITDSGGLWLDTPLVLGIANVNEPTTFNNQSFSHNENVAVGSAVGTLIATDPDVSPSWYGVLRYYFNNSGTASATSADGRYTVDAVTGAVTTAGAISYETGASQNYAMVVRDNGGTGGYNQFFATLTIGVGDLNEPNAIPATQSMSVNENVAIGSTVGTVVATDQDLPGVAFGQQRYYFLNSGVAAATSADGRYTINATTGVITTAAALNYEAFTGASYTVIARDNAGSGSYNQVSSTVTIGVNNVNEANAIPATYGFGVNENVAIGTAVGTVAATDADSSGVAFGQQRYYFLNSGVASATSSDGRYAINATTGAITTAAALNFEAGSSSVAYTVVARDNAGAAGYIQASSTVTIGIGDLNEANSIPASYSFGVNENVAIGTGVGTVAATDPDSGGIAYGQQRYYFSNGGTASATSADGRFTINATTGVITTAAALDYEAFTGTSYTVLARDNAGAAGYNQASSTVTIGVNNLNEANSMTAFYSFGGYENVAVGTGVGTVAASDIDSAAGAFGQQRYYFWNGSSATATSSDGRYAINSVSGLITVAGALNYEAGSATAYTVVARDNAGAAGYNQVAATVTLVIYDVNEQNSMPGSYSFGVNENVGIGTGVGTVAASDPDTSSPFNSQRYYFWNGSAFTTTSSDGRYAINVTTGAITTASALDFEAGTTSVSYSVYALDNQAAGGYTQSGSTVTIGINNVNEQNSMPGSYSFGVNENVGIGTAVGTVAASDPDTASPFNAQRYYFWNGSAFTSTSSDGRYTINATTGAITTAAALNFEAGSPSVAYAVYALDNAAGGGYTQSASTVTIGINNLNEQNSLPGSYSFGVYENVGIGTAVGTVVASDPDTSSPFNTQVYYFWNGSAFTSTSSDGRYAIDVYSGVITTAAALNYEAGNTSVAYTVYALDNGAAGGYTQAATTVTIGIADVNEAPSAASSGNTYQNYAAANTAVGNVTASDPEGSALTYSIVSVTNLNEGSGVIADYRVTGYAGGATVYTNHFQGNGGWRNRDVITVRATDSGGLYYDTTFTVTYNAAIQHQPIVLDLDGDGVELVSSLTSNVYVDMNGDGVKDRTGWAAADDGFLALDRNGDGIVTDMGEISFVGDLPGAVSDLEGLAAHDTNHNGTIDAGDAAYGSFMVWQDRNQDGISQASELRTLAQAGITTIGLTLNRTGEDPATAEDNVIYSTSSYGLSDGTSRLLGDVMLSYQPGEAQLAPPVILDLDGDGVTMTDLALSAVRFDMDGDGVADRTGWVGAADGLLALDRNADGIINDISEISFVGDLDGARTDLEGLRAFDSNHDGLLSPADAKYGDFRVWIDADQDGVSDAGELKRLPEVGVLSIDLDATPTGNPTVNGGNVVYNLSHFTRGDGSTGTVGDVGLAFVGSATGELENSGTNQALPKQYAYDRGAKRYQIETKGGQIFVQPRTVRGTMDPAVGGIDSAATLMFRDGAMGLGGAVVLDLDGDGVELKKRKKSHARFDMNADGVADDTGWVGKSDGILVLDRNGNGVVDGAGETSFIGDLPGAKSALEGLQAFDSNRDGVLDAKDDKFGEFRVWQDLNGNGVTEGGEMKTLQEAGIASIGLDRRANDRKWKRDENILVSTATFTRADGSTGTAGDVAFAYKPSAGPASGLGEPASDLSDRLRALRSGLDGWVPARWPRFTEVGFDEALLDPGVTDQQPVAGGDSTPTSELPGPDGPIAANDPGPAVVPPADRTLPFQGEGRILTTDGITPNFAYHGRLAYLVQQMASFGARSGESLTAERASEPQHHDYFAA